MVLVRCSLTCGKEGDRFVHHVLSHCTTNKLWFYTNLILFKAQGDVYKQSSKCSVNSVQILSGLKKRCAIMNCYLIL